MFVLLFEPVLLGSSGVRKPRLGITHRRVLQAPHEMTYIRTGPAQGLIFHRVPPGQSKGPIQGAPYTGRPLYNHGTVVPHIASWTPVNFLQSTLAPLYFVNY